MDYREQDGDYLAKARELALSGKFKTYIEIEAAMILAGYPALTMEYPRLAFDLDTLCNDANKT